MVFIRCYKNIVFKMRNSMQDYKKIQNMCNWLIGTSATYVFLNLLDTIIVPILSMYIYYLKIIYATNYINIWS